MESTLLTKKHKLSCGHTFHTDCIMSWFRSKKNTCPYCRCTGVKTQSNISINNTNLLHDGWESNEHVQVFLSGNATKNQTIEAYYIRDINNGISIDNAFNYCVKKIGIDPADYEKQIQNKFKRNNEENFKLFLANAIGNPSVKTNFKMLLSFNEYLLEQLESDNYKSKLDLYHEIENMKNCNNHKGIYSLFDLNNLKNLGW